MVQVQQERRAAVQSRWQQRSLLAARQHAVPQRQAREDLQKFRHLLCLCRREQSGELWSDWGGKAQGR